MKMCSAAMFTVGALRAVQSVNKTSQCILSTV